MLITIALLAYNEERLIERTLRSLLDQSVFRDRKGDYAADAWEIVVVPNGCKDRTHEVAQAFLARGVKESGIPNLRFRVESLEKGGKSNAWNELVHRIASPETDSFVMMDSDIEFGHPDTIHNCLARLHQDLHVRVIVDLPLKDFTRKPKLSMFERLSAGASKMSLDGRPGISGQFYCIRGPFVRQVWMPVGLSVEDGFLNAMVQTDCFRTAPDLTRVVRVPDASHYFEGLSSPGKLIRHEVRIVIGTVLNCFLCWDTLLFVTPKDGPGAGDLVRRNNEHNPDWYRTMMMNQVRSRGCWVVPLSFLVRRFSFSRKQSFLKRVLSLPMRMAATMFDAIVYVKANRQIRSERAIGFW